MLLVNSDSRQLLEAINMPFFRRKEQVRQASHTDQGREPSPEESCEQGIETTLEEWNAFRVSKDYYHTRSTFVNQSEIYSKNENAFCMTPEMANAWIKMGPKSGSSKISSIPSLPQVRSFAFQDRRNSQSVRSHRSSRPSQFPTASNEHSHSFTNGNSESAVLHETRARDSRPSNRSFLAHLMGATQVESLSTSRPSSTEYRTLRDRRGPTRIDADTTGHHQPQQQYRYPPTRAQRWFERQCISQQPQDSCVEQRTTVYFVDPRPPPPPPPLPANYRPCASEQVKVPQQRTHLFTLAQQRRAHDRNEARQWRKHKSHSKMSSVWKTAVDPSSGRTYYYHTVTRETQWRKPMELASEEERQAMEEKEARQRDFFAAMEANILRNMQTGNIGGSVPEKKETDAGEAKEEGRPAEHRIERPKLIKTISSMDERILKDLVRRVPSHRNLAVDSSPTDVMDTSQWVSGGSSRGLGGRPGLRQSTKQQSMGTMLATLPEENEGHQFDMSFGDSSFSDLHLSEDESSALSQLANITDEMAAMGDSLSELNLVMEDDEDDSQKSGSRQKVETAEDVEAMLAKVGQVSVSRPGISRTSMSQRVVGRKLERPKMEKRNTCGTLYVGSTMAAPDVDATIKCVCGVLRAHILQSESQRDSYDVKYAIFNDRQSEQKPGRGRIVSPPSNNTPSHSTISSFYRDVFLKAQMETDCIIMSLIYVERLLKCTEGQLRPRASNWRSVLFSCMVLASKVWDDLSMWNVDFSQTCPAGVEFSLQRINALELAVLDALSYKVKVPASEYAKYYFLLRSMLIKSGLGGDDLKTMNPLDVDGAKKLQVMSSRYQKTAALSLVRTQGRSKSLSLHIDTSPVHEMKGKASLEHFLDL